MNAVKELGKRLAARLDEDDWGYIEPFLNECETELESLRQQLAEVTNEKREYQLEAQGQIEFLDKKLAECQAQEAKLREALKRLDSVAHISCGSVTEALALPNDATALNELIAERMKTQKEYYESVFQDGANRIAELNAEVELLKGEQYVQLDIHTDDTRTKQQRELDGSMEVGQLLADSENSTASNSAFKGTEHLTWVHTGNGYISDSSGRFIGAFSGDFRNRDRFICAVNSENQLRQQNAELTAQRDALLAFAASYIAAWNNGSTGDSDIFFMAESAIANCKEPGK